MAELQENREKTSKKTEQVIMSHSCDMHAVASALLHHLPISDAFESSKHMMNDMYKIHSQE